MSVDVTDEACRYNQHRAVPQRAVLGQHSAPSEQQAFVDKCQAVLLKAQASGQRSSTALYLILAAHAPVLALTEESVAHLTCAECRPHRRPPEEQYPCRTAQQAFWALDALLR
jgi:hypothetical protein